MRFKHNGYIFLFIRSDHDGHHIHVFKDDKQLGVYDRHRGAIRGLEKEWNKKLQEGIEAFIVKLNDRGYFN
jgi:hypothetical protein